MKKVIILTSLVAGVLFSAVANNPEQDSNQYPVAAAVSLGQSFSSESLSDSAHGLNDMGEKRELNQPLIDSLNQESEEDFLERMRIIKAQIMKLCPRNPQFEEKVKKSSDKSDESVDLRLKRLKRLSVFVDSLDQESDAAVLECVRTATTTAEEQRMILTNMPDHRLVRMGLR